MSFLNGENKLSKKSKNNNLKIIKNKTLTKKLIFKIAQRNYKNFETLN